jgi:hypothetical protein
MTYIVRLSQKKKKNKRKKKLKVELLFDLAIPVLGIYPKEMKQHAR